MSDLHKAAWERDYSTRGRRWGGSPPRLPDLPAGSLVLEAGCGDGKNLAAMNAREWNVVALDFSPTAISLCADLEGRGSRVAFVAGDASRLPFRTNSFDAVFLIHVTGHAMEPVRCMIAAEAARVTRKGGLVVFREFSRGDMRAGSGKEIEPHTYLKGDGISTHYFIEEEAVLLFPDLATVSVVTHQYPLRIKGKYVFRAEIEADFFKA
jgi:ubiquinone/menaquinone biosynthesis C-methylase UbiE